MSLARQDAKTFNWNESRYLRDMRDLLGEARSPTTRRLLLATPPPVFADGAFDIQADVVNKRLPALLPELAASKGCEHIDLSSVLSAEHVSDGVHPTADGHTLIAQAVGRQLLGIPPEGAGGTLREEMAAAHGSGTCSN